MGAARQVVYEAWNAGLKPPVALSVSSWADRYRVVAPPSPEPGPWRTARTPYLRGIMDCLSPRSAARTIALMKGSQTGGTECALNWVGYDIHQDPSSFLIVLPTQGVAEEWSKTRFDRLVESTPVLRGAIPMKKSRDADNTLFNKKTADGRGLIKFAWSSSAAKQRSTPARNLILDEVDAFEGDVQGEGDPVTSLKRRFTNFPRGKMFMASTPAGSRGSRINREFLAGDRRLYFLPCPYCGHYQAFSFGRLKWPPAVPNESSAEREARYAQVGFLCGGCEESIPERFKGQMLAAGIWVATAMEPDLAEKGFGTSAVVDLAPIFAAMEREKWVSFHLPAGCSPLGWYSWSDMARDWEAVQGKRDVNAHKVFVMQVLGEPWNDERGEAPDDEKIWARRETYEHFSVGEGKLPWNDLARVPRRGLFLTAAVDIQQNPARLEVGVKAWGRGKEAWHIGYWVFPGDVSRIENEPWDLLADLLAKDFPHEGGGSLAIMAMAIDTGYLANVVYEFALEHPRPAHNDATGSRVVAMRTVIPTAGTENWQRVVASVTKTDAARKRQNVRIWKVGGGFVKSELYGWLRLPIPEKDEPSPGFQHYPDYHRLWFTGLCAEERKVTDKGRVYWSVIPGRERNEPLDTEQYQRLAAAVCGMDRWRDAEWQSLEERLGLDAEPVQVGLPLRAEAGMAPEPPKPVPMPAELPPQKPRPIYTTSKSRLL